MVEYSTILSMAVFLFVILLILLGFKSSNANRYIKLICDYSIVPLIGVLILLITFTINFKDLIEGIIGSERIKPYAIIILFMSLAYLCISIDLTGFFEFLALKVALSAGNSGRKLFIYFFIFSSILTVFTSNDIVILTITPIVIYFTKYAKVNPIPYLIAQFFAANIWSLTLYIGNPTNIIVAEAYGFTFLNYSFWMLLPTVSAGITCLILLLVLFRKEIPSIIEIQNIDPHSVLKDKNGALFGIICLISCLILLSLSPWIGLSLWQITLSFAFIMVCRNLIRDLLLKKRNDNRTDFFFKSSMNRMPWKIMSFVLSMFILVEALTLTGWVDLLASLITIVSFNYISTVFFITFISALACNIMNNQPMTILFTQILFNDAFATSNSIRFAALLALIMGSNFGANLTLIGALAGIMWQKIAADKDIEIKFIQFSKYGFSIMPLVMSVACIVMTIELTFWL